ncbi:MAG: hypothetical protein WC829_08220 [Hyphomicrobium sp.]|jgi:hypothetical protein
MSNQKPTCKTGLKKNVIKKDVFERELALCKNLSSENGGKCGWGVCSKCGVLPLLYKLHEGILLEKPVKIKEVKNKILL